MMRGLAARLALIALSAAAGFAQPAVFRSNDFGMQLQPVPSYRRDEYRWVLEVSRTPAGEVRRLFDNGREARRWETSTRAGGGSEEREIVGGSLAARRTYSPAGDILQEDLYSKGALTQKSLYTYSGSRLSRLRVLTGDGKVLYTQQYLYTLRGGLREVRRTAADGGVRDSSFVAGSSGLAEERNSLGETTFISRYDTRGRLIERETHGKEGTRSVEEYTYREDSDVLLASTEKQPLSGKTIARKYDTKGRLAAETVSAGGKVLEETTYARDDEGREISRERRSSAGLEQWRYSYDSSGKKTREEYRQRGSLAKVTLYGEGEKRTEELYQSGELFLKAFFDGDRRLSEEVYSGGKLVRKRTFE